MDEQTTTNETTENNKEKENMNNKPVYDGCGCSNPNAFAKTMNEGFSKVFGNMKSYCILLVASLAILIGCKTIPTTEKMYSTSRAIGVSAGMIANLTKISDTNRNAVIDIMNAVETCIPETNQTFATAWTPIAKTHVQKLVDAKKIDAVQGELILGTFTVAVKGIDYLFEVRFPKARQYQDLTEAAVHGFCGGFLTVFKPTNTALLSVGAEQEYDKEAYEYLTK